MFTKYLETKTRSIAEATRIIAMGAMDVAVREDIIARNPIKNSKLPRKSKANVKLTTLDTAKSFIVFIKENQPQRGNSFPVYEVLLTLYVTGVRTGEILALRWEDVDFIAQTITISGTIKDDNGVYRQSHTKTDSGYRTLKISSAKVWGMLKQRYECKESYLVFPNSKGKEQTVNNFNRCLRDIKVKSDNPVFRNFTPYDFRKGIATHIGKVGTDKDVANQLGHSNTDTARKHYIAKQPSNIDNTKLLDDWDL